MLTKTLYRQPVGDAYRPTGMGLRVGRTPDGRRIEVARAFEAPAADAWDLLIDTDRWPEWGPTLSAAAVDGGRGRIGPGATGWVAVGVDALRVPFEVESFAGVPDYRWTWRVAGVPATGHRAEALPDGRCRVVFEVPPLAARYAVVCRRALDRIGRLLAAPDRGVDPG